MSTNKERPLRLIVASKSTEKYISFDKRSRKPIYYTDPGTTSGAVVELLDHITVNNIQSNIDFIPPNPIAIQLEIMSSCIQKMKDMALTDTFKKNSSLIDKEKIYQNTKIIYEYISLTQQAIIFGYTALETFTNLSIPENYKYEKKNSKHILEIYDKKSIERWIPLKEKISEILVNIYQTKSIKKQSFWNDFIEFEKYRNEIIHQKSIDHSEFYRKYFKKDIFKYLSIVNILIIFFHNEAKSKGIGNILWPWLTQDASEIPTRYGAKDFFRHFKVNGNLYEGVNKK